jgi:hypothetical protein
MPARHFGVRPIEDLITPIWRDRSGSISIADRISRIQTRRRRLERLLVFVMVLGCLGLCLLIAASAFTVIGRSTFRLDPRNGAIVLPLLKYSASSTG